MNLKYIRFEYFVALLVADVEAEFPRSVSETLISGGICPHPRSRLLSCNNSLSLLSLAQITIQRLFPLSSMEINQDEAVESPEADQLWIKLEMDRKIENPRACGICGKVFGSGKAIGGHMRIHAPNSNREANQKPRVDLKPVCELCGKVFPTMHSLFGHMRCHPERSWRGIRPPNSDRASSSSSSPSVDPIAAVDPTAAVDLTDSLLRWSVTARRGRRAAAAALSSEVSSSEHDEMLDAVNNLLMLSRGGSSESGAMRQFSELETENVRVSRSETQLKIDQTQNMQRNAVSRSETQLVINQTQNQQIEVMNVVSSSETKFVIDQIQNQQIEVVAGINVVGDYDDHDHVNNNNNNSLKVIIKKKIMKKRKKKKLCDLKVYRCSTCDRSFQTHQALGGHCASHNKFNSATILTTTTSYDDDRETNNEAARSSDTSQKVMDIDLNEAPAPEDEAGFGTD